MQDFLASREAEERFNLLAIARNAIAHAGKKDRAALDRDLNEWKYALYSYRDQSLACEWCVALLPDLLRILPASSNLSVLQLRVAGAYQDLRRWDDALAMITVCEDRLPFVFRNAHLLWPRVHEKRGSIYRNLGIMDLAMRCHVKERESLNRIPRGSPGSIAPYIKANLSEANLLLARSAYQELDSRVNEWLEDKELYPESSTARGMLLLRTGLGRLDRARSEQPMILPAREALRRAMTCDLEPHDQARVRLALTDAALLNHDVPLASELFEQAESIFENDDRPRLIEIELGIMRAVLARQGHSSVDQALALSDLERTLDQFIDDWSRSQPRQGGYGFLSFQEKRRHIGELCSLSIQMYPGPAGVERAFGYVLRAQAMNSLYRAPTSAEADCSVEELRKALCPTGHGFLIYLPASIESHLFLLDNDALTHFPLTTTDTLSGIVSELSNLSLTTARSPDSLISKSDARLLLPPEALNALERWSHVTVIGGELLGGLYIEELPFEDGRIVGEELAIGYSSSLPTLLALAQHPPASTTDVWWVANPTPTDAVRMNFGSLPDLPLKLAQARGLFEPFGDSRMHEFFGEQATKEALYDPELGQAALLHILCHGIGDWDRELPAGLVLRGPSLEASILFCENVSRQVSSPPLVLLSACSADQGPKRLGDSEVAAFSGAFLRAGAQCVVLSTTALEFYDTFDAMSVIHRELARGRAPSEALRVARRQSPRALRLHAVGLAHRPVFPVPSPRARGHRWILFAAPLGAALGLLGTLFVRRNRRVRS